METTFVGICSIDLYSRCHALPNLGETIHGIALNCGFGGKAPNACAQFAFLSDSTLKPNLLTAVGNDSDGKVIVDHFKEIGVSPQYVQVSKEAPSGLALCFVLDGGESAIVIHPCPVTIDMVHQMKDKLANSKLVVTNFEIPIETALEVLKISRNGGAKTILNVSPVPEQRDINLFKDASVVIVNEVELASFGSVEDLFNIGVECVVQTQGAKGATILERGKQPVHVPSIKVDVVDTTGAGDSFLGSFTYCLAKGCSYEEAAKVACITAAISVTGVGTQGSYAHRDHPLLKSILP
ncbi:kinase, pfkB family protein [Trichomonas vaginalis G3]|uniref:Kinase, pfkB family protein n=1 Tax=Trichomonas vaginalis (strain ATCC PRA-98 / G3) TaxID=412133 RepID=A2G4T2_TRIV3|nr:carbohydrate kinase protein [Trichomonas vaginalis G3]EAX87838.1 kinase, pfkB family protein [Trichomonas vaginalis G3]KAI5502766.1 carbohydrate kinase protein [Trichomonas vaginalis G3]|eukprot:XP_001300768.1 kinase, pfkB family protein [Trichomonas vaginalis G3]